MLARILILGFVVTTVTGCGSGTPHITFASQDFVTVKYTNNSMSRKLTVQVRQTALDYCRSLGKEAEYTGSMRDSGFGPEEYDFKCVDKTIRVENSGSINLQHSGSIEVK